MISSLIVHSNFVDIPSSSFAEIPTLNISPGKIVSSHFSLSPLELVQVAKQLGIVEVSYFCECYVDVIEPDRRLAPKVWVKYHSDSHAYTQAKVFDLTKLYNKFLCFSKYEGKDAVDTVLKHHGLNPSNLLDVIAEFEVTRYTCNPFQDARIYFDLVKYEKVEDFFIFGSVTCASEQFAPVYSLLQTLHVKPTPSKVIHYLQHNNPERLKELKIIPQEGEVFNSNNDPLAFLAPKVKDTLDVIDPYLDAICDEKPDNSWIEEFHREYPKETLYK